MMFYSHIDSMVSRRRKKVGPKNKVGLGNKVGPGIRWGPGKGCSLYIHIYIYMYCLYISQISDTR